MENQLSKIIKELIKGVNVEGVKSIDWAKELQSMYELVEKTEKALEIANEMIKGKDDAKIMAEKTLAEYMKEFVIPAREIALSKSTLEKDRFEFDTEKKWILQDRNNLLEIVKMMTTKIVYSLNESGGNGNYKNESYNASKPELR